MEEHNQQAKSPLQHIRLRLLDLYHRMKFLNNSAAYWNHRYTSGGNSGFGSYGQFAEFKADVINSLIRKHSIQTAVELGCGDGNQLGKLKFPNYTGIDVSSKAIDICRQKYRHDTTKTFVAYTPSSSDDSLERYRCEMALSLDVIYHLVEDDVFDRYMRDLFSLGSKFVVVFSSDTNSLKGKMPHFKHRKFTDWIAEHIQNWELIEHIPNPNPEVSDFEFFVYQRS